MTTYIALLRGINVGGHKLIKMPALKACFEGLGLSHVQTYIQSGNVVFASDVDATGLLPKIRDGIEQQFGFSVELILNDVTAWHKLVEANPFAKDSANDPQYLHLTLLNKIPDEALIREAAAVETGVDEAFAIIDNAIYLYCPNGYGLTKLDNKFWEKKLKVIATTRNWNTVRQLLQLAETE
jgi:uncharacterized protein (DUF1697 family)